MTKSHSLPWLAGVMEARARREYIYGQQVGPSLGTIKNSTPYFFPNTKIYWAELNMEYPVYAESGWTGRKALWIKKDDNVTDAYHVELGGTEIVVRRAGEKGAVVGRIKIGGYVEIVFEDYERVEMRKDGLWTRTQVVNLPAMPEGSPFKWEIAHSLGGGNLKLIDSTETELAFFEKKHGFGNQLGTLRIKEHALGKSQLLDQIIVTFAAMEETQRRQQRGGGAVAGAGGPTTVMGVGGW